MKLIAVSFNEQNHYELHKSLFEKARVEFSKEKILDKGVYPQELETLNYYPMVNEDLVLYIKKESLINIKFYLTLNPDTTCGYYEVFENGNLIYKDDLYPYYPQT